MDLEVAEKPSPRPNDELQVATGDDAALHDVGNSSATKTVISAKTPATHASKS